MPLRNILRWMPLLVLLLTGFGSSWLLSETYRADALRAWTAQADRAGQWLSGNLLNWLEASYAPVSGLAALAENSSELSESEFLNAYDTLESRAGAFFLEGAAYLRPDQDGRWQIAVLGKNLSDEKILTFGGDAPLSGTSFFAKSNYAFYNPGRTIALQGLVRF